jgi:hypothetical protein
MKAYRAAQPDVNLLQYRHIICEIHIMPFCRFPFGGSTMRTIIAICLTFGLVLFMQGTACADDAAKDLLEKATKAHGGDAAKLQNLTLKGKSSISQGGVTIDLSFDMSMQGLDKVRMAAEVSIGAGGKNSMTIVLNNDKAWAFNPSDNKTEEAPKDAGALFRQFMMTIRAAASPTNISGKDLQLAHGGEGKVGETTTSILRISQKDQPDITLHYDKATFLPVKAETRLTEPNGGGEANYEFLFSDFRATGGVKHFAKFKLLRDGKELAEVELSDFKVDQQFEASTFAKP